jgi:quercetin dioxygenase-like cupin family protein
LRPAPVHETVVPVSRETLPGGSQELIAVEVRLPPGAAAVPHRHPAFVYAYVLSGSVESALEGEAPRTYRAGQSWHEEPGALHRVTRNPSRTQPARLLAVFIAKAGEKALVVPEHAN